VNEPSDYTPDLEGFIRYAEDMRERNTQKQLSIQDENAIRLLTIHKSKGLGFDTVFLYCNTADNRTFPDPLELDFIVDNNSYNKLSELFVSINYKAVLEYLFDKEFQRINFKREIEEINNLYVAMTRAKTNLNVFWVCEEKESKSVKRKIAGLGVRGQGSVNSPQSTVNCQQSTVNCQQSTVNCQLSTVNCQLSTVNCQLYTDIPNRYLSLRQNTHKDEELNLKHVFLTKKSKLIGSAAHVYLSFIKYDLPEEHEIAILQTIRLFGNILSKKELNEVVSRAKDFINNNSTYFSNEWDRIYNEFGIYDRHKHLYRIDRLMVNTRQKQILIIDYKTGEIEDENQVEYYKTLIKQMAVYKRGGYSISGEYVVI
jgi:ATP-dependent exoDNAse (exonuclease V) beta subunit